MIPKNHPRYHSLKIRHLLIQCMEDSIVAPAGLIAHGRGEAFDYIIGETTTPPAKTSIKAAAAMLLLAENPVISINGNVAALVPKEINTLANNLSAPVEINLFYRSDKRIKSVANYLKEHGIETIYGCDPRYCTTIPELSSQRRIVDKRGIYKADVVFVPLEDGDRTQALKNMGKSVITVDLNPLSRTSITADITIVDNITRAMELLVKEVENLKSWDKDKLVSLLETYDNRKNLKDLLNHICRRLKKLAPGDLI